MSNFFDNLIARSYNLKPVARPRVAARFEPPPGSLNLNDSQTPALEVSGFEQTPSEPTPNTPRVQLPREPFAAQPFTNSPSSETEPPPATQEHAPLAIRSRHTDWHEPNAAPTLDAANSSLLHESDTEVSASSSRESLSSFDSQSSVETPAHETRRTPTVASGHSTSMDETTELEREADAHEGGGERSREEPWLEDYREFVRAESSANVAAGNRRGDDGGARRRVAPAKVAARSSVREGTAAPSLVESGSVETPDAAPVVRVSIGRIDVRAVMADSRARTVAPPARQAPQALSLEEYLKQRNGGGR